MCQVPVQGVVLLCRGPLAHEGCQAQAAVQVQIEYCWTGLFIGLYWKEMGFSSSFLKAEVWRGEEEMEFQEWREEKHGTAQGLLSPVA